MIFKLFPIQWLGPYKKITIKTIDSTGKTKLKIMEFMLFYLFFFTYLIWEQNTASASHSTCECRWGFPTKGHNPKRLGTTF